MIRAEINPELLRWARDRSRVSIDALERRFPRLSAWERGEISPTLAQVEGFAKATHTPVGYLFLAEPPVESVPIPDFRTVHNVQLDRPSPNLLEVLYICQQRQDFYREFARINGDRSLPFVSSARVTDDVADVAEVMRQALGFDIEDRYRMPTWTDALRRFINQAEAIGILVMCSGVVASNSHRRLDPDEFRGFAISDPLAPLVFVNGSDTKSAQMFTLAHEIAHVWLGQSALSDSEVSEVPEHAVERWANQVAAELLVPMAALRDTYSPGAALSNEINRLARRFKVSTLVVLRRLLDAGVIKRTVFQNAYQDELEGLLLRTDERKGGNFYLTQAARVSKRFARAAVISALEGRTSFTESFRLLGVRKMATFRELGRSLDIPA